MNLTQLKSQFQNFLSNEELSRKQDEIVKSKSWSIFRRMGYVFIGIPVGWSLSHYFVIEYGGTWPPTSTFRLGLDLLIYIVDKFGGLGVVVGAGIAIYRNFFYKKRK